MKWKAYPVYKDVSVTWLSKIPNTWGMERLKLCIKLVNEKSNDLSLNGKYIGLENIESWTGKTVNIDAANSEGQSSIFEAGDVLFNKLRPYLAKVIRPNTPGTCTGELLVLRPKSMLENNYLFYYLLSKNFINTVDSSTYGSKMPRANWEFIGNLPLLIPSKEEQHAISSFLDRKTDHVDDLIAKKQQQIELLQEKRSALISHVVTKGLNPNVKMKDSGVEWLGKIPEHWIVKRIKYVGKIKYGLGEPPRSLDNGLPIIRATDISNGNINMETVQYIDPNDVPWSRDPALKAEDILVVRSGAYTGDSAIVPSSIAGAIAGYDMVLRVDKAVPQFVAFSLLSKYLLNGQIFLDKLRAAQPHLNAEELGNCLILIPPKTEQKAILVFLNSQIKRIDEIIIKIEDSVLKLQEYRCALISAAVTGKIDVWQEATL